MRDSLSSGSPAAVEGGFLGDEFQGFEHGFVEFGVGVVEVGADGEGGDDGGGRDHVLDGGGEVGEGFHEGDDAFAFLDLDFRVFDPAAMDRAGS